MNEEIKEAMAGVERMMKRVKHLKDEAEKAKVNGYCNATMTTDGDNVRVEADVAGTEVQLFALIGSIFDNMEGDGAKALAKFVAEYLIQQSIKEEEA